MYGMRGIGKTAIARKLAENLSTKLDRVVWICLREAPNLTDVLEIVVKELGGGREAKLSKNVTRAIDKMLGYLKGNRCLLVFDNADEVLSGDRFPDYAQFFDRLNLADHDSCCLAIAIEKISVINTNYQELELQGLDRQSCQMTIKNSQLVGTPTEWDSLVSKYRGNPQYLKLVANTIADVFTGNIARFLAANILVYDRICILLSQQLDCLSNLEIAIIIWLTIEREPISLDRLKLLASSSISDDRIVKTLDKLVRKYLIEIQGDRFTLPDLIMEYMIDTLPQQDKPKS